MQVHRKGTEDAIKLTLRMTTKTNEELSAIVSDKDGRQFVHDVKTRAAAERVLAYRKARGVVTRDVVVGSERGAVVSTVTEWAKET